MASSEHWLVVNVCWLTQLYEAVENVVTRITAGNLPCKAWLLSLASDNNYERRILKLVCYLIIKNNQFLYSLTYIFLIM